MNELNPPSPEINPATNPNMTLLEYIRNYMELSPVPLRGLFLLLTRMHWANANNYIGRRQKLTMVWNKDPKLSSLVIDYDYNYDPKKTDRVPAIFVGTDDFNFEQRTVDAQVSQSESRNSEKFMTLEATNIIIRHIGKSSEETLLMGDQTMRFYQGSRKLLQESLGVSRFMPVKLMASRTFNRSPQDADQQFVVDLILNLQYTSPWSIVREGHLIKTVTLKMLESYGQIA